MAAASATIKAIDATAVHRIQSGQVIVNLCSVVKELLENSIDAGATSIEVRFKNQGLDAVEVQDNGSGIAPANYESLALKHYTSKLATYDDLDTLETFGFRGEALSSLCALSRFSVVTCLGEDVPKGVRLDYNAAGHLATGNTPPPMVACPRAGTTVTVADLFWNLPVRRRELERNIKREWGKVISLLNQYACIETNVRLTVTQQPTKGRRVVLFATKGNAATRDNIINVFGAKTMGALLELDLTLEMEPTGGGGRAIGHGGTKKTTQEIRVRGYVSRPAHGQGRQTPDRQMFYVNGRPCKLPQFAQLFGEVYRAYNSGQSPFIFADIQLDTHLYDVNVSPDKQTILLHDQGRMLDNLRESLIELFEKQDITVPMSQLASSSGSQKISSIKKFSAAASTSRSTSTLPSDVESNGARSRRASSPLDHATASSVTIKKEEKKGEDREEREDSEEEEERDNGDPAEEPRPNAHHAAAPSNGKEVLGEESSDPDEHGYASGDEPDSRLDEADDVETTPKSRQLPSMHSSPLPTRQQHPPDIGSIFRGPRKRLSDQVATVTVGDETVSTKVVSSPKRLKTAIATSGKPIAAAAKAHRKQTKAPLPSFGGRLSQMFAAAGQSRNVPDTEMSDDGESASSDADMEGDEEDEEAEEEGGEEEEASEEEVLELDEEGIEVEQADEEDDEDEVPQNEDEDMEEATDAIDKESLPSDTGEYEREREMIKAEEDQLPVEEEDIEEEEDAEEDAEEKDVSGRRRKAIAEPALTEEERRNRLFLKSSGSKKRHDTLQLLQTLKADEAFIGKQVASWQKLAESLTVLDKEDDKEDTASSDNNDGTAGGGLDDANAEAEAKLSLKIVKSDFAQMRVIGQFNLGFILAVRAKQARKSTDSGPPSKEQNDDELFIIDQHASDEKFNFERLQASTVVQSQRLVRPKRLELTAVEEEVVLAHQNALAANGFAVQTTTDGSVPVGERVQLLTLPLSRETTFDLGDLEELIALLADRGSSSDEAGGVSGASMMAVVRPSKVRKMFAMRACRSSIMIGKALTRRQMSGVLRHMGEMDKPWNCPHGRPTMRHLCSLGTAWDGDRGWREDGGGRPDGAAIGSAEWARFLEKRRK